MKFDFKLTKGVLVFIIILSSLSIGVLGINPDTWQDHSWFSVSGTFEFICSVVVLIWATWSLLKKK